MHRGLLAHQIFHRVDIVQAARPEVLVVPGVLADGDGQPHSVQFDHLLRTRGRKVTLLVEDVVERQQPLVLLQQQTPSVQQNGGIDGWLFTLRWQCHSCQHGGGQSGGRSGQLIDRRAATGQKAGLLQKIGGRVAANNQFGKDRQPCAQSRGAAADGNDFFQISGKISDGGIDLRQGYLHTPSLIPCAASIA